MKVGITSGAVAARTLSRVNRVRVRQREGGEGSTVRNGNRSVPASETSVVLRLLGQGEGDETVCAITSTDTRRRDMG
jgi:hypothetical protein